MALSMTKPGYNEQSSYVDVCERHGKNLMISKEYVSPVKWYFTVFLVPFLVARVIQALLPP